MTFETEGSGDLPPHLDDLLGDLAEYDMDGTPPEQKNKLENKLIKAIGMLSEGEREMLNTHKENWDETPESTSPFKEMLEKHPELNPTTK